MNFFGRGPHGNRDTLTPTEVLSQEYGTRVFRAFSFHLRAQDLRQWLLLRSPADLAGGQLSCWGQAPSQAGETSFEGSTAL